MREEEKFFFLKKINIGRQIIFDGPGVTTRNFLAVVDP